MDFREIFNYGVPTGLLLLVLWAIWRTGQWAKQEVVAPIVKSHLALIEMMMEHLPRQTDALDTLVNESKKAAKLLKDNDKEPPSDPSSL